MDTDDKKNTTLSDKERAEVKKNIKQLRAKYERTFTSGEFIERTNADKIFVVQIPNLKELKNMGALNNRDLHEKAKKCYAIEFYKKGRKDAMRMLIFTYDEVSIETILGNISKYFRYKWRKNLGIPSSGNEFQAKIYKIINGFIKTDLRIYKIIIVRIKTNFNF